MNLELLVVRLLFPFDNNMFFVTFSWQCILIYWQYSLTHCVGVELFMKVVSRARTTSSSSLLYTATQYSR